MVLVLFSGGVDSMLLAEQAHRANKLGRLLFIDYGQPAADQERAAAFKWAQANGYTLTEIPAHIRGVTEHMATGIGSDGLRILPGRNLLLLSHAMNVAKATGCEEVWYGANAGDRDYPDCTPGFVELLNRIGAADTGVSVKAPLLHLHKHDILETAKLLGLDLDQAWSCYEPSPSGQPCGACHSCLEAANSDR